MVLSEHKLISPFQILIKVHSRCPWQWKTCKTSWILCWNPGKYLKIWQSQHSSFLMIWSHIRFYIPQSNTLIMYLNVYQYQSNFRQYGFIVLRQMPAEDCVFVLRLLLSEWHITVLQKSLQHPILFFIFRILHTSFKHSHIPTDIRK